MDHSPIRQTFEFGKSISTAGMSILNCPVKFANFVYVCITQGKALPLCGNVVTFGNTFSRVI